MEKRKGAWEEGKRREGEWGFRKEEGALRGRGEWGEGTSEERKTGERETATQLKIPAELFSLPEFVFPAEDISPA